MLGFERHDHRVCIRDGLQQAQAYCSEHGLNFTPIRQKVLQILLAKHRALGAYEVLDFLKADQMPAQPPVAYRALDFLVTHGFAHKIERLNAFVSCAHAGRDHAPAFLICSGCNTVAEAEASPAKGSLGQAAKAAGFRIERTIVEAVGLCPTCQDAP